MQRWRAARRAQLLGMFDVLRDWFGQPDFHGCAFLNASGEIPDADDPCASSHASTRHACWHSYASGSMRTPTKRASSAALRDWRASGSC